MDETPTPAVADSAPEAPPKPPPSLFLDGDEASLLGDAKVGDSGTLTVNYTVRSISQSQDGGNSVSLDLSDIKPSSGSTDEPAGAQGGEAGTEGESTGDADETAGLPGDTSEEDDAKEEKALGYKRPKKKGGIPFAGSAAKNLGNY